SQIYITSPLTF
nr:immunoglobulin light chain junction region [Macaca mulatta]